MTRTVEENDFQRGMELLLKDIALDADPTTDGPFPADTKQLILEHGTRILFFDRFMTLLGWKLGHGGDVAEEARIVSGTTKFIDYVGVNDDTEAAVMILEAKAWDKVFVRPRPGASRATETELILTGVLHVNAARTKASSPVIGDWHDYLDQVRTYVRAAKQNHGYEVPCAVLASGQWMIVFTNPARTFVDNDVSEGDIRIFQGEEFATRADEIYRLLSRAQLGSVAPQHIRPTQITQYVSARAVDAVYQAVLVSYQSKGTSIFARTPLVLVYPVLIVQRDDGALFTIVGTDSVQLSLDRTIEADDARLDPHLAQIAHLADALKLACEAELESSLPLFDLGYFPGFPRPRAAAPDLGSAGIVTKAYVRAVKGVADEWFIVTGDVSHYLRQVPALPCRFHNWSECHATGQAIDDNAVSSPKIETPRAFFVDGDLHHCAHQTVSDRRRNRCHIAPLDMRTCCSACVFNEVCWPDHERRRLPCGAA